jgi:hypothetical protein
MTPLERAGDMLGTRLLVRLAAGGLAAGVMLAIPATALADPVPTVTPVVNCITAPSGGTYTAVFGYTNSTSSTVTIKKDGAWQNSIFPSNFDGPEPELFKPGTTYGAFKLTIPVGEYAIWTINGNSWAIASQWSPPCGSPAPLPQDGNGYGITIFMVVAGIWGLFMLLRPHTSTS